MVALKKRSRPRTTTALLTEKKPTNGHLAIRESKRTIILSWGKYSITLLCMTALAITFIQKIKL